jgi:hypothetical protein
MMATYRLNRVRRTVLGLLIAPTLSGFIAGQAFAQRSPSVGPSTPPLQPSTRPLPPSTPPSGGGTQVAPGPLRVLGSNPGYFATPDGKAIYLTGFHTWTDGMSFANAGTSSFTAMADYMSSFNVNLIRLWEIYGIIWPGYGAITPLPFNRSGTCCASDGGNKFDVTRSVERDLADKLPS